MMTKAVEAGLLLLLFTLHVHGFSAPGKPTQIRCRSPEKETFTCWWEPGSDGGLPTSYALYYRKENSDTVYECPDYHTAGTNSCFFNKNNTSIWVNYNITVVASNALGRTFSDPVDIDVVYIVMPNPPERVAVTVMEDKGWPFLRVSWEPPHKADTRSGWITLIYEIRVKLEEEADWEMHLAGQQKMFNIFSLHSGGTYLVEVRCKPDHGFWSEWSSPTYVKVPDYFHREKSVWILVIIFSAFIFLILTWLLHMNSHSLKHCLLPPVPGPKIKGFDKQLLKNGKSEEIFSELVVSDFPPTTSSNYEELLVEYLEVYIPEEQELMLGEGKDLHDGCLKCESSTSDSDSGHGSCDSHTLLMDKCSEAKEERQRDRGRTGKEAQRHQNSHWEKDVLAYAHKNMVSPDLSSGRVKTWPSVFSPSPLPQYGSNLPDQQRSLKMAKHQYLSDSLFPPGCESSYLTEPGSNTREALGSSYSELYLNNKPPHSQEQARLQLQAHSDINISSIRSKQTPGGLPSRSLCSTEYVEVQRVNEEDMVLLQPVTLGMDGCPQVPQGEDYSKVKAVERNNVLLLQREVSAENSCPYERQETNGERENCYMPSSVTAQKSAVCGHTAMPAQDEMAVAVNGYIDTATMCTLPSY